MVNLIGVVVVVVFGGCGGGDERGNGYSDKAAAYCWC